jgi:long-chain acyl-CoA synthetase
MPRNGSKKTSTKAPAKSGRTKAAVKKADRPTAKVVKPAKAITEKTEKAAAPQPRFVALPARRTTEVIRTRARFTDPMRAANEYTNVRDLIQGQGAKHGNRTFLIFEHDGREYSYLQLDEQTTRAANLMSSLGAQRGARIAILMNNSPEYVFAWLGAMKAGMVAVPISTDVGPEEFKLIMQDCGAALLFTSKEYWPLYQLARDGLPGLLGVVIAGEIPDSVRAETSAREGKGPKDVFNYASCMKQASLELKGTSPQQWDEAQLCYTGRSLDMPRGAVLQQRQFLTSARCLSTALNFNATQRMLCALPLFHVNAQVTSIVAPLCLGGSVVLFSEFSASRFWPVVERYKATAVSAVPSMLGILTEREIAEARGLKREQSDMWPSGHESPGALRKQDDKGSRELGLARAHDISSLRLVISGAAALPAATQLAFEKCFLVPVLEGYSLAETSGFATLNPLNGTRKIGSVGKPLGDKIAIWDEARLLRPLEGDWTHKAFTRANPSVFPTADTNQRGEICIWGEGTLKEYFNRPEDNPKVFAGGWFHSGDLGRIDADGFVYVLGRKGEFIERDGDFVSPREVDEALMRHELVETAQTLGTPGDSGKQQITTFVILRKGAFKQGREDGRLPAGEQEKIDMLTRLRAFAALHLSEKKRPTTIVFAASLPTDATGKTRVHILRKQGTDAYERA